MITCDWVSMNWIFAFNRWSELFLGLNITPVLWTNSSVMVMFHSIIMITSIFILGDVIGSSISSAFCNRRPLCILLDITPVLRSNSTIMVVFHSVIMITSIFVLGDVIGSSISSTFCYRWPRFNNLSSFFSWWHNILGILWSNSTIMVVFHSIIMIASIFVLGDVISSSISSAFCNRWPLFS